MKMFKESENLKDIRPSQELLVQQVVYNSWKRRKCTNAVQTEQDIWLSNYKQHKYSSWREFVPSHNWEQLQKIQPTLFIKKMNKTNLQKRRIFNNQGTKQSILVKCYIRRVCIVKIFCIPFQFFYCSECATFSVIKSGLDLMTAST